MMMIPGLALRSAAMCFQVWIAYIWPGPDSSEAMRLMADWASVKMVTFSGVVCRLAAVSSALARAAQHRGFLVVAHVSFDAHPALTSLPCNRISSYPAIRRGPSVNMVRPGLGHSASVLAAASFSCIVPASNASLFQQVRILRPTRVPQGVLQPLSNRGSGPCHFPGPIALWQTKEP
jgi:hypothetical protein